MIWPVLDLILCAISQLQQDLPASVIVLRKMSLFQLNINLKQFSVLIKYIKAFRQIKKNVQVQFDFYSMLREFDVYVFVHFPPDTILRVQLGLSFLKLWPDMRVSPTSWNRCVTFLKPTEDYIISSPTKRSLWSLGRNRYWSYNDRKSLENLNPQIR